MYEDPILRRIVNLMNQYGPKKLRGRWSIGDSLAVPKGLLPHAFVAYDAENISDIAAGELRVNAIVTISVAVDMTREINTPTDRSDAHEQVVEFISAKDTNSYQLKPDSILGALRAHQDLDLARNVYIEVGSETTIEYGVGLEKRGPGIVTAEGVITFQITHDQVKPA